jgi:hypothetical protein
MYKIFSWKGFQGDWQRFGKAIVFFMWEKLK